MSHPFFLPPEWAPHAATWSVWPRDDAYWSGCLAIAQADLAGFLNTLAEFEQVRVLVHDEATKRRRDRTCLTPLPCTKFPIATFGCGTAAQFLSSVTCRMICRVIRQHPQMRPS